MPKPRKQMPLPRTYEDGQRDALRTLAAATRKVLTPESLDSLVMALSLGEEVPSPAPTLCRMDVGCNACGEHFNVMVPISLSRDGGPGGELEKAHCTHCHAPQKVEMVCYLVSGDSD